MKDKIFLLLLISISLSVFGQFYPSSWRQIENDPNYLKTIPELYELNYHRYYDDSPQSEYNSYQRYMKYWNSRIGVKSNGEYSYQPYIESVLNNSSYPICDGTDPADWQLMGPTYHEKQQQGLFTEVLYDPDFPDKLIASTNYGGLWKFNPTNNMWYNVTDELRVPGLSANDILRNPYDPTMIFVATGNGQWHTEYGVGLLVSTNRGENWTINQSFLSHINYQYPRLVRVLPDPNDLNSTDGIDLYVAGIKDIYIGLDNGTSWQTISPSLNLPSGEEIYDMEVNDNGNIIVGTQDLWNYGLGKAYILINGQWQDLFVEQLGVYGKRTKFSTPYNNLVYAVKDRKFGTGQYDPVYRTLYKSLDGGVTWTMIKESIEDGGPKCEIEYSPDSDRLYCPEATGLAVISPATGNNIHIFNSNYDNLHADVRDISICGMSNGIEKVFIANDGGISEVNFNVNTPANSNVLNKNGSYLPCNNVIGLAVSNSSIKSWFTSATHQGTFNFTDNQLFSNIGGDGEDGIYHPKDYTIFYKNKAGNITDEYGNSITPSGYYENGSFINMRMEINPNNPDILYFGLVGKLGIYDKSTDQTIYSIITNADFSTVGPIAISKDNDIYIADYTGREDGESGKFMVSTNGGTSFIDKSFGMVKEKVNGQWVNYKNLSDLLYWNVINGIVCNPDDNDELWVAIGRISEAESFRVLHTTDGGTIWYDYSTGLPEFPAIDFLYHYETETLFLGTDVGVFYRQPNNDINGSWACFSNGLPVAAITEMDINECTNELFVSLQSRSVFASPIPFSLVNPEGPNYLGNTLITGPNDVWNTSLFFDGDVTINSGASLTINADCYFSEGNRILVLPGGKLIVNATLGNHTCGGYWDGIQVSGNNNQAQHPDYQGLVYLNSGAIIKHANAAIATYQIDSQGNVINNTNGGIIKANGARFINCRIGCEIIGYNYSYNTLIWQTEVKNCEFYNDGNYYALFANYLETPRGIELVNNKRISIENNSFTSDKSILSNWSFYPIGIQKFNSQAIIKGNTFDGLSYGVYSRDYYPGIFVDEISENDFNANIFGIYENGVTGSQIYLNHFNLQTVAGYLPNSGADNIISLYKNSCINYMVEENDFDGDFAKYDQPVIGLLINNGGSNDQLIYKNDFFGYDYAILAQGTNRNSTGSTGLTFKCNDMTFEHSDISVSALSGTINPGIAASQGSGTSGNTQAAGNLFNNLAHYDAHFWNLSSLNATVTYHHHISSNPSNYDRLIPGHIDPSLINGVIISENDQSNWISELSCPSQLYTGIGGKEEKLATSGAGIVSTETTLNLLIDAGNTQEMATEVQTAQSSEAYQLQTELLNSSPYLSNEVLETATDKEDVLTNPLIRDVLVANPQSAKNEEVLELIENRVNPMPQYMKDQIISGQALISAKEQMEAELHYYSLEYNNTLSMLVAEYSNENGENYSINNLKQMLANAHNREARYQLAGIYLNEGNAQAMSSTLNSVASDFTLNQEESQELGDMTSYFNLVTQLKAEGRKATDLTSSEIDELMSLYENSENKASVYARNLLLAADQIEYEAPVIFPDMGNKSTLVSFQTNNTSTISELVFIEVYPNPAKDYIIFEYDIAAEYSQAQLLIYQGVKGELLQQTELKEKQNSISIGVKDWAPGTYIASIQVDDKLIKSIKFTIAK